MNIGFKYFTGLQWVGVIFIVNMILMLFMTFFSTPPPILILFLSAILFFFSLVFIEWPKKDGFKSSNKKSISPELKKIKIFMEESRMEMEGYGGLCIHGLVVSEFGYLLRYLTDNELERFNNFRVIADNKTLIDKAIGQELSKEVLRESEVFGYSREITEGNIINLQSIVHTITEYVALCDELGVDPYGIHGLEEPKYTYA